MKKKSISLTTVIIICVLFCSLLPTKITAQEKNSLVFEVLKAYKEHGSDGVKEYTQKNKDKLNGDSIIVIAMSGKNLRNETVIKIAIIMAESIDDKKAIGWSEYYLGNYYYNENKSDDALSNFNKVLPIFIEINDLKGQALVNYYLGQLYLRVKKYALAKESFLKVIQVSKQFQNDYLQGSSYSNLGEIYFDTGDSATALKMYSNALVFFEKDNDFFLQASTFYRMGIVYTDMNEYQKAIDMFSKSAAFYKLADKPSLQAIAIWAQGDIYRCMNNYEKALEMFTQALPQYEKENDNLGQGNIYYSIGKIYLDIGDSKKAMDLFSKALPFYEKVDSPLNIGESYQGLADVCYNSNDIKKAVGLSLKAAVYYKRASARYGLANLFLQVGESVNLLGQYKESLESYSHALSIYEAIQDLSGQGIVNLKLGNVYAKMGENKKAFEMYSTASSLLEKANSPGEKASLLLAEANLFNKENEINKAYLQYDSALTILEKIRTETGFAEMKMAFVEKSSQSIEDAILFMINNKYPENAFKYLESVKARTLLDQLAEKNIGHVDKGLNPQLKQTRDKLITKLSFTKSSLTKAINEEEIAKLQKQQNSLEQEWDKLSRQIRFQNPAYAATLYPQTVTIKTLQNNILKPKEALLNYFVGSNDTYVYVITRNYFQIVKLPNNTSLIEKEVQTYQRNLQYNRPVYESDLYQLLIEPITDYIKDCKTLLIAPDGFLTTIPFEAIIVGYDEAKNKTKYLIEDYTIKYIQSASMLSLLRTTLKRTNTSDRFIGFGDPVYDYQNFVAGKPERGEREKEKSDSYNASLKGNSYDRSGGLMNRLEGSGQEVKEIARLFGENKSKVYTRIDAKEENIKTTGIKDYGYIVLSCHGLASDEFQSLVLSQTPNSKEDGYLTIDEIMNLDWNARLVVLSACQTGKGKIRRGEGVIGLTRAVMHAGTPAAVVSLWNVSDEGTKELMIKLFQNILKKNLSKEEALKKAKLEMLNSKLSNPYFWSAFVMYGE